MQLEVAVAREDRGGLGLDGLSAGRSALRRGRGRLRRGDGGQCRPSLTDVNRVRDHRDRAHRRDGDKGADNGEDYDALFTDPAAVAARPLPGAVVEGEACVSDVPEVGRLSAVAGGLWLAIRRQGRGIDAGISDLIGADALAAGRGTSDRFAVGFVH